MKKAEDHKQLGIPTLAQIFRRFRLHMGRFMKPDTKRLALSCPSFRGSFCLVSGGGGEASYIVVSVPIGHCLSASCERTIDSPTLDVDF